MKTKSDSDVISVLEEDGLPKDSLITFRNYENVSTINVSKLREDLGMGSWAVRIAYNELFGGVVIQQQPGEGNRKHFHPDADENWVILEGKWEWWIEGEGAMVVSENEIIVVPKNTWHKITCIGDKPGIRYAITRPDVNHVYEYE